MGNRVISHHRQSAIARAVAAVMLFSLMTGCDTAETSETSDAGLFSLVEEKIEDIPIKTQIVQHVVAIDAPTKEQLEAEVLTRYNAAKNRNGFRYHRNPTNIYIYIYGSEEQARDGQGLWIAMLAKSYGETGEPSVVINEERLATLTAEPEDRFGLSESDRKQLFAEIGRAQERATDEAMSRIPDIKIMEQLELEQELAERYKAELAAKYGLTDEEVFQVMTEGVRKGWLLR